MIVATISDYRYIKHQEFLEKQSKSRVNLIKSYIKSVRTFETFFSTLVPFEFEDKPWLEIYFRRLMDDHDWIYLFFPRKRDYYVESYEANHGHETTKLLMFTFAVGKCSIQ